MSLTSMESFAPFASAPPGFDEFWSATAGMLDDVSPLPVMARQASPAEGLAFDHVTYASLGGERVAAYLLAQDVAEPRPLIVHSHGYNSQYDIMLNWAGTGCHVFGLDFRGFGRSTSTKVAAGGYVLDGIQTPQTSILRGAVCDLLQGVRAARLLLGWRVSRIVLYGFSFGGAMALMAGSLTDEPELLVVGQPTFGWHRERLRLSKAGSSLELNRFLDAHPDRAATVLHTLDYFDSLYFAPRLRMPALLGVGLDDDVVPSRSVIAIANALPPGCSEVRFLPVAHSADPRESLWADFDEEWLFLAQNGVPPDFGSAPRKLGTVVRAMA